MKLHAKARERLSQTVQEDLIRLLVRPKQELPLGASAGEQIGSTRNNLAGLGHHLKSTTAVASCVDSSICSLLSRPRANGSAEFANHRQSAPRLVGKPGAGRPIASANIYPGQVHRAQDEADLDFATAAWGTSGFGRHKGRAGRSSLVTFCDGKANRCVHQPARDPTPVTTSLTTADHRSGDPRCAADRARLPFPALPRSISRRVRRSGWRYRGRPQAQGRRPGRAAWS